MKSNLKNRVKKIEYIRKKQGGDRLLLIVYRAPGEEYIWTDDKTNKVYIVNDTNEISLFYEKNHDEIIIFLDGFCEYDIFDTYGFLDKYLDAEVCKDGRVKKPTTKQIEERKEVLKQYHENYPNEPFYDISECEPVFVPREDDSKHTSDNFMDDYQ